MALLLPHWPPRAGRSLPRRFPLPAPFWARLPVSRAQKKILPAQQAQKKKPPRVPLVSGRGAGAGAGLRPMYATKKRAPQWLSYLPMSQKNERLWPPSPISGKKTQASVSKKFVLGGHAALWRRGRKLFVQK